MKHAPIVAKTSSICTSWGYEEWRSGWSAGRGPAPPPAD